MGLIAIICRQPRQLRRAARLEQKGQPTTICEDNHDRLVAMTYCHDIPSFVGSAEQAE